LFPSDALERLADVGRVGVAVLELGIEDAFERHGGPVALQSGIAAGIIP
jgi:hypothetical protein